MPGTKTSAAAIPGTADKTPLNRCNSLFRFPCKSVLQPPWVHTAQDTRIYDWDLSKSVTPNELGRTFAGSTNPSSLLLVSYLSSPSVLCSCCHRHQRDQVSRHGPNSPRIEQELFLHTGGRGESLDSSNFHPELIIFLLVS